MGWEKRERERKGGRQIESERQRDGQREIDREREKQMGLATRERDRGIEGEGVKE